MIIKGVCHQCYSMPPFIINIGMHFEREKYTESSEVFNLKSKKVTYYIL
jgi:hypothetical protein